MPQLSRIDAVPGLWRIDAATNGYLLVRGAQSLLIDCPEEDFQAELQRLGLPAPSVVLHTQVQTEHCGECALFPEADVYVSADSVEVALRSAAFFAACETAWPLSRVLEHNGEEPYGITGCTTERPPVTPLHVAGTLQPRERFTWQGVTLEVLALPGSGKRALGFYWREMGVLFSGDLLHAGGYLVNFYDCERGYGTPDGYRQLLASLEAVLALRPALLLPTTGPVIAEPEGDITRLQHRFGALRPSPQRPERAGWHQPPLREFGRYKEVVPGIYQCNNAGNAILYVDAQGRGLMIDPDPCIWLSWEESVREVHADLDLLERETGLRRIEYAVITHYHGDHCEYSDLLRERYGTVICATPDVAAVLERPKDFNYPCTIDWYNLPFDHITIDRRLVYEQPFLWNDTPVTPIHTPGHCFAHTGYLIPWQGQLTACTGDTLQYAGGAVSSGLPFTYNDNAWPDRAYAVTYRRLLQAKPNLIFCGHSHGFCDPDGAIIGDMLAVAEEAERLARQLIPDDDLLGRMTPPDFDAIRPAQVESLV